MPVRVRLAVIFALGAALVIGIGGFVFVHELSAGLRGSVWEQWFGYFQYRREEFLAHYPRR